VVVVVVVVMVVVEFEVPVAPFLPVPSSLGFGFPPW
jgi:hypothetical protein